MPTRHLLLLSLLFASAAFAQSADLNITAQGITNAPTSFSIIFAMTNAGPDVARNAVLTIEVPDGITINRFGYGAGEVIKECDSTQRPIRCSAGDVHVGMPYHYGSIDFRTTSPAETYDFTFTLTSGTPDPNPANNQSVVSLQNVVEADVRSTLRVETGRVDPGGDALFRGFICNEVFQNVPPRVTVELAATNGTIRAVTPPPGFTCTAETPSKTVCTIEELVEFCVREPFVISVTAGKDRGGSDVGLTMRASSNLPERNPANDEDSDSVQVYRWLTVDKTADSGAGSLRDAIEQANALCTPGPCRIVFEIPGPVPAEGWFTIAPATPLPDITAARVALEGTRQTAFTGDTNPNGPEIAIDGRFAGRGIRMLSPCEGIVSGLAIGNFEEDQGLWISTGADCGDRFDRREVVDNHIGVDPSGAVAWPNLRGLRTDFAIGLTVTRNVISRNRYSGIWLWRGAATFTHNVIEDNGASGVFLGPEVFAAVVNDNEIRRNRDMGIAAARELYSLAARRNEMQDNGGLAIDWGLDGVSPLVDDDHFGPTNAPVLLSARYDAARDRTTVTARLQSEELGTQYTYGYLDLFTNATPDGDGEQYIGSSSQIFTHEGTVEVSVPGDHRGKWINATWTREHLPMGRSPEIDTQSHPIGFMVMSSELSNAVLVE